MFIISIIGGTIQYSLSFYGLKILDGASATLFVQAEIPFGILIAYFLLGEKVPIKNIIGLIIAFVGIAILNGNPNLEGKLIIVLYSFFQVLFVVFSASFCKRCFRKNWRTCTYSMVRYFFFWPPMHCCFIFY